jgi:signal transduction histidine kinase
MLFDALARYVFNLETFHRFNFFLGTLEGELLKRSIELIFYLMIVYMVVSEFSRNKKREYKYLIISFFALSFRQAVMSAILFSRTFGVFKFTRFAVFIGFIDEYLEIVALLLLVAAFIFPAFKEKTIFFQRAILYSFYITTIITFGTYYLFKLGFISRGYEQVILFTLQLIVLISPFFLKGDTKKIRHHKSILLAFFIYLLLPLSNIISLLYSGNISSKLLVLQHPLPFISILLLMRTVYLKLVDKAFLTEKLRRSEKAIKYQKELNKLKDHFISIVSHELRTPITSMKLYLSLLRKGKFGEVNLEQDKAIKTLADENSRLSDLITNLLTINRIEANKLVLEKSNFYVDEIIDDLYLNFASDKGIKIINKVKRFRVTADKKMMKQVFVNLINNAIKFSDKGKKITISTGRKKNRWFLSVKDNGIGIPDEEIPKLFDKFYQTDNTLTRKNQGIGLGLAIVKNIVELHDGRIDVISILGASQVSCIKVF